MQIVIFDKAASGRGRLFFVLMVAKKQKQ